MHYRPILTDPIIDNNPVAVQILGVCSALAVTRNMWPALVMTVAVIGVLVFSNGIVSALRHVIPHSVRLILEMTLIASAVIVVDEALRAYTPEISATLSVFVGLIITNCIILGRAESFARNNTVGASIIDGLGNGLGYGVLLLLVAAVRELFGAGSLFDWQVLDKVENGGNFTAHQFMHFPASAFFVIAFFIWLIREWRPNQIEPVEYGEAAD